MKKILTVLLALLMVLTLAGCGAKKEETATTAPEGKIKVNIMSFTDEVPGMFDKFLELHPEYADKYEANVTIIATTDGLYQPALDEALAAQDENTPDIYAAEAAFILKYAQGDASQYAAAYEDLGIDVAGATKAAEIAQYTIDIGTRPADGKVVGLGYQCNGGVFIYRRSIAKEVLGSDDPAVVAEALGAGSGSWDKFWELAEACKAKGYTIVSGDGDVWHAVENSSSTGWVVDGKLNLPAEREEFLDISKKLYDNGYETDTTDWTEGWYADMKMSGKALGFYGPCWLINYTLAPNCGEGTDDSSWGDWAVCSPNIGFFWGGTWLLAGKTAVGSEKQDVVADFIKWVTLDTDENALQTKWANGTLNGEGGTPDSVASGKVMATANGTTDFCGGQNVFEAFIPANQLANGQNLTQYDEKINSLWRDQVRAYAHGTIDRDTAITQWKQNVAAEFDLVVE